MSAFIYLGGIGKIIHPVATFLLFRLVGELLLISVEAGFS